MIKATVNGVDYVLMKGEKIRLKCEDCAAQHDSKLCSDLPASCCKNPRYIWQVKDSEEVTRD